MNTRQLMAATVAGLILLGCRDKPNGGNPPGPDPGTDESVSGWISMNQSGADVTLTVHIAGDGIESYSARLEFDPAVLQVDTFSTSEDAYRTSEMDGYEIAFSGFSAYGFADTQALMVAGVALESVITPRQVTLIIESATREGRVPVASHQIQVAPAFVNSLQ